MKGTETNRRHKGHGCERRVHAGNKRIGKLSSRLGAVWALALLVVGSAQALRAEGRPLPDGAAAASDKHTQKRNGSHAPAAYYGPKQRIAVTEFEVKITGVGAAPTGIPPGADIAPPGDLGTGMAEMLATALTH